MNSLIRKASNEFGLFSRYVRLLNTSTDLDSLHLLFELALSKASVLDQLDQEHRINSGRPFPRKASDQNRMKCKALESSSSHDIQELYRDQATDRDRRYRIARRFKDVVELAESISESLQSFILTAILSLFYWLFGATLGFAFKSRTAVSQEEQFEIFRDQAIRTKKET